MGQRERVVSRTNDSEDDGYASRRSIVRTIAEGGQFGASRGRALLGAFTEEMGANTSARRHVCAPRGILSPGSTSDASQPDAREFSQRETFLSIPTSLRQSLVRRSICRLKGFAPRSSRRITMSPKYYASSLPSSHATGCSRRSVASMRSSAKSFVPAHTPPGTLRKLNSANCVAFSKNIFTNSGDKITEGAQSNVAANAPSFVPEIANVLVRST